MSRTRSFWLHLPASIVHALRAAWQSLLCDWKPNHAIALVGASYPDITLEEMVKLRAIDRFSMTEIERRYALLKAVAHITKHRIEGAILECGVWRGGSMMLAASELIALGDTQREIYLCDTFEGMTPPSNHDCDWRGDSADQLLTADAQSRDTSFMWCIASLEDVQHNLTSTGYPTDRLRFIKGPVETTLPAQAPAKIALLRLDTDWYESTLHELNVLYDRVVPGGIVIIDDYGHWQGARKAVDEFIASRPEPIFLHRVDLSARAFVKGAVS